MAVHRNARGLVDLAAEPDQLQIEELVERYGNQWLATARRSSPTAADAEDAYQRALEALLVSPPAEDDPERIAAWMHTVIRNEALQIVRSRKREIDTEFEVIAGGLAADVALPEESVVDGESHGVAKEALRRLRPDQTRCLLLRADGFDYPEICSLTGFSYAKVNRLLSEGRKAARMRVDAISAGRECERLEPLLSMFADGEADAAAEHDIRMHLDTCSHCKATVRDYKLAPRDLASLFPVGVFALANWRGRLLEPFNRLAELVQTRFGGSNPDSTIAVGKKALAVFAVGATVAGGGAVIEHNVNGGDESGRSSASDVARPLPQLLTPIEVDRKPASSSKRDRSEKSASVSSAETARRIVNDPAVADNTPAADVPSDQNTGAAADPKDTGANGAGANDQSGVLAP